MLFSFEIVSSPSTADAGVLEDEDDDLKLSQDDLELLDAIATSPQLAPALPQLAEAVLEKPTRGQGRGRGRGRGTGARSGKPPRAPKPKAAAKQPRQSLAALLLVSLSRNVACQLSQYYAAINLRPLLSCNRFPKCAGVFLYLLIVATACPFLIIKLFISLL